jgi:hypothetical protein
MRDILRRIPTRRALIIMTALLAAACDGPAPSPAPSATPTQATPAATSASATSTAEASVDEPLSVEMLIAANEVARKGDPLTSAAAALYEALGKPTRTSSSRMVWGVLGDEACTVLRVEHEGNQITEVHPAKTVSKSNAADFEACKKLLGG